jgi:acetylornithine deacetylase
MLAEITKIGLDSLKEEAIELLKKLIAIPSISRDETKTADLIEQHLNGKGLTVHRLQNNVWCRHETGGHGKPVLLLNSHHDTVKPAGNWDSDPFLPQQFDGKIVGLGANDAGASLVSLVAVFLAAIQSQEELPFDLIFAATAEEEISGKNGVELLLPQLGQIDFAIVGEPTTMQLAVAERGLMVLDCTSFGVAGHAARREGKNAIYAALDDINWFQHYAFAEEHPSLGRVSMQVTQIDAGSQHNVVPSTCKFVVDVRSNGCYSNHEILDIIRDSVRCEVTPRSTRLNASQIPESHSIVAAAASVGIPRYGSPTMSDQALMPFPTVKIGPGESARSHTANEYIYTEEIEGGIDAYISLLSQLNLTKNDSYETLG